MALAFRITSINHFTGYAMSQLLKPTSRVREEQHHFSNKDFIAGEAALDFVNTVTGRDHSPCDWLTNYQSFIDWAALTGIFTHDFLRRLEKQARNNPSEAIQALRRAKRMREEWFALLTKLTRGANPSAEEMNLLRGHWLAGLAAIDLEIHGGRLVKKFNEMIDLDAIANMIAYRIVDHVIATPIERLRMCEGTNCAWLYVDTSKANRRRWCDMRVCGNAAKSRRFYERNHK